MIYWPHCHLLSGGSFWHLVFDFLTVANKISQISASRLCWPFLVRGAPQPWWKMKSFVRVERECFAWSGQLECVTDLLILFCVAILVPAMGMQQMLLTSPPLSGHMAPLNRQTPSTHINELLPPFICAAKLCHAQSDRAETPHILHTEEWCKDSNGRQSLPTVPY